MGKTRDDRLDQSVPGLRDRTGCQHSKQQDCPEHQEWGEHANDEKVAGLDRKGAADGDGDERNVENQGDFTAEQEVRQDSK